MSNEIKISLGMVVENGSLKRTINPGLIQVDQAVARRAGHAQTIGAAEEVVDTGDLATLGYCYLRNLDDTYSIDYGPDSGGSAGTMVAFGTLEPGEIALLRLKAGITIKAQATGGSGASADLDVFALNN